MTYFIVEISYDKCFDVFFKDELGYPNFYRLAELLPSQAAYENFTLLAPYQDKTPAVLDKIQAHMEALGIPYLSFGQGLDIAFTFNEAGKVHIHPSFKKPLSEAVSAFLGRSSQKSYRSSR